MTARTESPAHSPPQVPPWRFEPRALLATVARFVLGERPTQTLPDRARQALAESQNRSEVLVCILQFCAIAFFGTVYALMPKAFPPDAPFKPVPWALGIYLVLTALRMWLALRGRLNAVLLSLSVVIDIAVLMVTIWSFHLQYQQPATLYLKSPTLLYVFILIALRAMRFEARYVILSGLAALVGWSTLVVYAIVSADENPITRDFVAYMTSNALLIGGEVDKLLTISIVTAVLAVAIVRARRLLVEAVAETNAAQEMSRFFAPEVVGEIRGAEIGLKPGDAVSREAAILMTDLRGFTPLAARLEPKAIMRILQEYQRRMVPLIHQHGGSIDKYMGDGIIATFGAVRPSATFAADALRALDAVLDATEAWNAERRAEGEEALELGVAVAVGTVLFGVTGDESRLEFTVIGEPVNLASKLEKHSKIVACPGLVTREALELGQAQGYENAEAFAILPREPVAGAAAPMDLAACRSR